MANFSSLLSRAPYYSPAAFLTPDRRRQDPATPASSSRRPAGPLPTPSSSSIRPSVNPYSTLDAYGFDDFVSKISGRITDALTYDPEVEKQKSRRGYAGDDEYWNEMGGKPGQFLGGQLQEQDSVMEGAEQDELQATLHTGSANGKSSSLHRDEQDDIALPGFVPARKLLTTAPPTGETPRAEAPEETANDAKSRSVTVDLEAAAGTLPELNGEGDDDMTPFDDDPVAEALQQPARVLDEPETLEEEDELAPEEHSQYASTSPEVTADEAEHDSAPQALAVRKPSAKSQSYESDVISIGSSSGDEGGSDGPVEPGEDEDPAEEVDEDGEEEELEDEEEEEEEATESEAEQTAPKTVQPQPLAATLANPPIPSQARLLSLRTERRLTSEDKEAAGYGDDEEDVGTEEEVEEEEEPFAGPESDQEESMAEFRRLSNRMKRKRGSRREAEQDIEDRYFGHSSGEESADGAEDGDLQGAEQRDGSVDDEEGYDTTSSHGTAASDRVHKRWKDEMEDELEDEELEQEERKLEVPVPSFMKKNKQNDDYTVISSGSEDEEEDEEEEEDEASEEAEDDGQQPFESQSVRTQEVTPQPPAVNDEEITGDEGDEMIYLNTEDALAFLQEARAPFSTAGLNDVFSAGTGPSQLQDAIMAADQGTQLLADTALSAIEDQLRTGQDFEPLPAYAEQAAQVNSGDTTTATPFLPEGPSFVADEAAASTSTDFLAIAPQHIQIPPTLASSELSAMSPLPPALANFSMSPDLFGAASSLSTLNSGESPHMAPFAMLQQLAEEMQGAFPYVQTTEAEAPEQGQPVEEIEEAEAVESTKEEATIPFVPEVPQAAAEQVVQPDEQLDEQLPLPASAIAGAIDSKERHLGPEEEEVTEPQTIDTDADSRDQIVGLPDEVPHTEAQSNGVSQSNGAEAPAAGSQPEETPAEATQAVEPEIPAKPDVEAASQVQEKSLNILAEPQASEGEAATGGADDARTSEVETLPSTSAAPEIAEVDEPASLVGESVSSEADQPADTSQDVQAVSADVSGPHFSESLGKGGHAENVETAQEDEAQTEQDLATLLAAPLRQPSPTAAEPASKADDMDVDAPDAPDAVIDTEEEVRGEPRSQYDEDEKDEAVQVESGAERESKAARQSPEQADTVPEEEAIFPEPEPEVELPGPIETEAAAPTADAQAVKAETADSSSSTQQASSTPSRMYNVIKPGAWDPSTPIRFGGTSLRAAVREAAYDPDRSETLRESLGVTQDDLQTGETDDTQKDEEVVGTSADFIPLDDGDTEGEEQEELELAHDLVASRPAEQEQKSDSPPAATAAERSLPEQETDRQSPPAESGQQAITSGQQPEEMEETSEVELPSVVGQVQSMDEDFIPLEGLSPAPSTVEPENTTREPSQVPDAQLSEEEAAAESATPQEDGGPPSPHRSASPPQAEPAVSESATAEEVSPPEASPPRHDTEALLPTPSTSIAAMLASDLQDADSSMVSATSSEDESAVEAALIAPPKPRQFARRGRRKAAAGPRSTSSTRESSREERVTRSTAKGKGREQPEEEEKPHEIEEVIEEPEDTDSESEEPVQVVASVEPVPATSQQDANGGKAGAPDDGMHHSSSSASEHDDDVPGLMPRTPDTKPRSFSSRSSVTVVLDGDNISALAERDHGEDMEVASLLTPKVSRPRFHRHGQSKFPTSDNGPNVEAGPSRLPEQASPPPSTSSQKNPAHSPSSAKTPGKAKVATGIVTSSPITTRSHCTYNKLSIPYTPYTVKRTARHSRSGSTVSESSSTVPYIFLVPGCTIYDRQDKVKEAGAIDLGPANEQERGKAIKLKEDADDGNISVEGLPDEMLHALIRIIGLDMFREGDCEILSPVTRNSPNSQGKQEVPDSARKRKRESDAHALGANQSQTPNSKKARQP